MLRTVSSGVEAGADAETIIEDDSIRSAAVCMSVCMSGIQGRPTADADTSHK